MDKLDLKSIWASHSKDAIGHWGDLKSEPLEADFTNLDNFKQFLIGQYGWDKARADEEIKWFADFTRSFESK